MVRRNRAGRTDEGRNEWNGMDLFRTKPLETILVEAEDKGEGTLKRTLGVSADAAGRRGDHRHGDLRAHGAGGGETRRAGGDIDDRGGHSERPGGVVLFGVRIVSADLRFGLHVQLRHIGRVHRVIIGWDLILECVRGGDGRGRMVGEYDQSSGGSRHSLSCSIEQHLEPTCG